MSSQQKLSADNWAILAMQRCLKMPTLGKEKVPSGCSQTAGVMSCQWMNAPIMDGIVVLEDVKAATTGLTLLWCAEVRVCLLIQAANELESMHEFCACNYFCCRSCVNIVQSQYMALSALIHCIRL